jgi:glycosyltransferase involved in cell wall biosynthesis
VVYCYGSALSWIVAGSVVRRKKHARFAVDVTELYGFEDIFKSISFFRSRWGTWIGMFIAIPLTASAIAVPSNYYLNIMRYFHRNVYLIPPFFGDLPETQIEREDGNRELTLVYAGSPSTKEQFSTLLLSLLRLHKDIDRPIRLKLVGFSDSQIDQMLVENGAEGLRQSSNVFIDVIGRTDVATARRIVRLSDFLIVIRRSSLRVNCGFPSKVAEAFCLGTPIITNKYSDINLYLKSGFNGFLIEKVDIQTVTETLLRCVSLDINDILSLEKGAHATGYTCFSSHAVRQRIMQFIS